MKWRGLAKSRPPRPCRVRPSPVYRPSHGWPTRTAARSCRHPTTRTGPGPALIPLANHWPIRSVDKQARNAYASGVRHGLSDDLIVLGVAVEGANETQFSSAEHYGYRHCDIGYGRGCCVRHAAGARHGELQLLISFGSLRSAATRDSCNAPLYQL